MTTELDRFLTDLRTDTDLQAAVTNDTDDIDSLVKLANARGYNFTLGDYTALEQQLETGDMLTDEQLEAVAGGGFVYSGSCSVLYNS
jgi:predicted ribosomally synthesized peptide with nif11-like leader